MSAPARAPRVGLPILLALVGQVLVAGLSVLLARWLSPPEFEAYAVAAAAFTLMVTAAPLGADKLALRVLPPLAAARDAPAFRAYVGFATRRCLTGSAVAIAACLAILALSDVSAPARNALLASCAALPAATLAHLALEALTAAGRPAAALAIVRVGAPAVAGAAVLAIGPGIGTGAAAIAAWGAGWIVALGLAWRASPPGSPAVTRPGAPDAGWRALSAPLWVYRLVAGVMAQAGILALEFGGAPSVEVGAYAAATSLVALATVLATATNRLYAREISQAVARTDRAAIRRLRRRRAAWLAPVLLALLVLAFRFTDALLGLYRPEFVAAGHAAFRLLAVSAALSILLAPAASLLKLTDGTAALPRSVGAAVLVQALLLGVLVPGLGATGAAASYLAANVVLFGLVQYRARQRLAPPRTG
ncbi:MAG: hypothetical protein DI556_17035 [Rhodovulum sulfidophilum]|uniref:Polysaccharide biosynthesis protein C-terminal domain-containing protein n=1 Tax=Rhodovulum sulfidophilum TaxID=35806 RepID=A0A2W5Q817_RHOSU|nr:MAG: hypothetical protein DI556_17035 [Rhodovulum sulfidophilum]